tara:strand:- start:1685 stop:2185 length:501 start_codon:yes stop_codon:yes gene_type:complete
VRVLVLICTLVLASCNTSEHLDVAEAKLGMNEYQDRTALRRYVGVDPRYTEWCAAFVNAVLADSGMTNLEDMKHPQPLTARSFLDWGEAVDLPLPGDIVIFPRGTEGWQGHVGFYVGWEQDEEGKVFWKILGGNQNDSVSIDLYPASKALGVRRYKYQYGNVKTNT